MPIYSSKEIVSIADVKQIYLDALKRFPVMHLSPFEKIIDGSKSYILSRQMNGKVFLKPNITKQGLLFRGDSKIYNPFTTKQRRNNNPAGLNYQRFEKIVNSFPLYKMLSGGVVLPNGETLCLENPYGLAYTYDVKTPFIGFTSDLDVAMFYATTSYDPDSGKFEIVKDGEGVLYAYELRQPFRLTRSLSTLGLQVFPRTFGQKTFLLQMPDEADLNQHHLVIGFKFNHQKEKAEEIFEQFKGGELLASTDDFLWKKLKRIEADSQEKTEFEERDLEELYQHIDEYWESIISLIHFEKDEEDIRWFLKNLPHHSRYCRYFDLAQYYNER